MTLPKEMVQQLDGLQLLADRGCDIDMGVRGQIQAAAGREVWPHTPARTGGVGGGHQL